MDNAVERQNRNIEDERRQAVHAAQRSDSNVFLFRRLKWGWPTPLGKPQGQTAGGLRIVDVLLIVVIVCLLGYSGAMLLGG